MIGGTPTTNVNMGSNIGQVKETSPVQEAFQEQSQVMNHLEGALNELERRLGPCLISVPESAQKDSEKKHSTSELHSAVLNTTERILACIRNTESLRNRITL